MFKKSFSTTIEYLDDSVLLECVKGDRLESKTAVFAKRRNIIKRYFNVPLQHVKQLVVGDFGSYFTIGKNEITYTQPDEPLFTTTSVSVGVPTQGWKIPSVLYKTDKHILIAPTQSQLIVSKIIYGSIAGILLLFAIPVVLVSFFFGPLFLLLAVLFLLMPLTPLYLFFFKKSYISVAPLQTITSIDIAQKTITIEGIFDTGIPSFLKNTVSAELYVGDNIYLFSGPE